MKQLEVGDTLYWERYDSQIRSVEIIDVNSRYTISDDDHRISKKTLCFRHPMFTDRDVQFYRTKEEILAKQKRERKIERLTHKMHKSATEDMLCAIDKILNPKD